MVYRVDGVCVVFQDDTQTLPGRPGVLGPSGAARAEAGRGCQSDRWCASVSRGNFYRHIQKASQKTNFKRGNIPQNYVNFACKTLNFI